MFIAASPGLLVQTSANIAGEQYAPNVSLSSKRRAYHVERAEGQRAPKTSLGALCSQIITFRMMCRGHVPALFADASFGRLAAYVCMLYIDIYIYI